MKIVLVGAVQFSEKALTRLIAIKANVVGVCTLEKSSFNISVDFDLEISQKST